MREAYKGSLRELVELFISKTVVMPPPQIKAYKHDYYNKKKIKRWTYDVDFEMGAYRISLKQG